MLHQVKYCIEESDKEKLNELLALGVEDEDSGEDELIYYINVTFENGIEADIKVYNSEDGPWIDSYLVDESGITFCLGEPDFGPIDGDYYFYYDEDTYKVTVV